MFGRKKRIEALERKVEDLRWDLKTSDAKIDGLKSENGLLRDRVNTLEKICQELTGKLEQKMAELEAKRVPVISDLTGGGNKEKPVTAKQIMDEWFNGKAEGGEGK